MTNQSPRRLAMVVALLVSAVLSSSRAAAQPPGETLHVFSRYVGNPTGRLTIAPDGTVYGTASIGSSRAGFDARAGLGAVYAVRAQPDGSPRIVELHSFSAADGHAPLWGVTLASDGNLYGTASGRFENGVVPPLGEGDGTPGAWGTIFRLTPDGAFTVLREFSAGRASPDGDGAHPASGLLQARDGHLYGTTNRGSQGGTLFRVTLAGSFTTIATLPGRPVGDLAEDADGNLYVVSDQVNPTVDGCGAIFRVTTAGDVSPVFPISGSGNPVCGATGGVVFGTDGSLYGSAGAFVYKVTPSGTATMVHVFDAVVNQLMRASDGNVYGTVRAAGQTPAGSVFRIDSADVVTTLHTFTGDDGSEPRAALVEIGGLLLGSTYWGGEAWAGELFAITPGGAFVGTLPFRYSDGGYQFGTLTLGADVP